MAKHDIKEDKAKVRFRFFDFELEGSNAALESTVRTMATTLARREGNGNTAKALKQAVTALPDGHIAQAEDDVDEDVEVESVAEAPTEAAVRTRTTRTSVEQPKFLGELDIKSADVSLQDFIASHDVGETDWKRCVGIAMWFKHHMKSDTVTIDHIFTGYRIMGWKLPKRIRQPLNDATNKKQWFKRAGAGNYSITYLGEDEITKTASGQ